MVRRTPMSSQDALWLTMGRPNNLMVIDGVMILAENTALDEVRKVVRSRVIDRFPVYRRKPVRSGRSWCWQDDPDFDISRHVKRVQLPEPVDIPAVQRFMSQQRAKSLPRSRPLWVVFVIDGVRLEDGTVGSAIVSRFHHAMADGVRLTQVMLSMCDSDRRTEGRPAVGALVSRRDTIGAVVLPFPLPAPLADTFEIAIDSATAIGRGAAGAAGVARRAAADFANAVAGAVVHSVSDPIGTAVALPGALAAAPRVVWYLLRYGVDSFDTAIEFAVHPSRLVDALAPTGEQHNRAINDASSVVKLLLSNSSQTVWSGRPGTTKAIAWSAPISLSDVKAVSRSQNATANDVLLAAVAGGIERYLQMRGDNAREIQWLVPVNLKPFADNLPAELGNYFALVMLPMPLGITDRRARIQEMKSQMERIKHSDEAVMTFGLQRALSVSPGQVQFSVTNFFADKTAGVLTNVPGPADPLRFAGSRVVQIVGFAPCSGDQPMAATIFSYNNTVTIGFATDAALVPDPEVLVELVTQEAIAMKSLLQHRPPALDNGQAAAPRLNRTGS